MLKNKGLLITIFIPILSWLVLPSLSFGETKVGGPIFQDTTWTVAGSPYIVVMNAGVEKGVTLTIEPGVTVKFDGLFFLEVSGSLIARGTEANSITFTSNKPQKKRGDWQGIKFLKGSVGANLDEQGNYLGGSILEYCNIEYGENTISYSGVSGFVNSCTITNNSGTAISAFSTTMMLINNSVISNNSKVIEIWKSEGPVTITNCTISNNSSGGTIISISAYSSWGKVTIDNNEIIRNSYSYNILGPAKVIYLENCNPNIRKNKIMNNSTTKEGACIYIGSCKSATISYNVISQNSDGRKYSVICAVGSTVNIDHNLIKGNTSGIRVQGIVSVTHNTITNNSGQGVDIWFGKATISDCNIHDNTDYDVYNYGDYDIQATNNWWGTEDPLVISEHIYDYFDNPRKVKGKVIFTPYLTAPVPDAGPSEEKPPCPLNIITNICVVKAPAFMRGDETTLNFLWLNATKN